MQLAARLLGMIGTPLQPSRDNPMQLFLSASIGVAITSNTSDEALPVRELIDRADQAMYLAKKSGKNNIQFFA
jgi:GGDEF domain-containing protein